MPAERLMRTGSAPAIGIVHFGPGAFFRAFNAVFTDQVMAETGDTTWGICAISLRSATFRDQLVPQGGVYTSVSLAPAGAEYRQIGAIAQVLVAPEDPGAVLAAMTDPAVKIVSLTITEKGYCHEPATGRLNPDHPDIVHDLANLDAPRSAPGFIVAALAARRAAGLRPFTVLTCDNLPSNGRLASGIVLDLARKVDPDLAEWIKAECRFPSTMVDRITPATTEADIAALESAQGYHDPACVTHEPFRQWVIEDDFVDGVRPAWDQVGAQLVGNVDAHEHMKLRCLNGTHSTLAYLGYLAGYETIAETVGDRHFARLLERLWAEEIIPTVPKPEGEDLPVYAAALLERFRNPAIRHRTWQIAMDGSQKLPQRLLGTVADNLAAGRAVPGLALGVAGWMRYIGGVDEQGQAIDVRDPLADRLRAVSDSVSDPVKKVAALLSMEEVFDRTLAEDATFRDAVTRAYLALVDRGAKQVVEEFAA